MGNVWIWSSSCENDYFALKIVIKQFLFIVIAGYSYTFVIEYTQEKSKRGGTRCSKHSINNQAMRSGHKKNQTFCQYPYYNYEQCLQRLNQLIVEY